MIQIIHRRKICPCCLRSLRQFQASHKNGICSTKKRCEYCSGPHHEAICARKPLSVKSVSVFNVDVEEPQEDILSEDQISDLFLTFFLADESLMVLSGQEEQVQEQQLLSLLNHSASALSTTTQRTDTGFLPVLSLHSSIGRAAHMPLFIM